MIIKLHIGPVMIQQFSEYRYKDKYSRLNEAKRGSIITNSNDSFYISLDDVTESQYQNYLKECREKALLLTAKLIVMDILHTMNDLGSCEFVGYDTYETEEFKGMSFEYNFTSDEYGVDGKGTYVIFPSEKDNKRICRYA